MKLTSYFYLFIATIIWAAATPLVKLSFEEIDPYFFLFLRFAIVALVCLPYLYWLLNNKNYTSYDWFNIGLYSIVGQINLLIFFIGLDLTSPTDAIIIGLTGPILTIAAGHYFYKENLTLKKQIGIFLAFLGTVFVVIEPLFSQSNGLAKDRFTGNLLILLHVLIGSFWLIYSKFLFGKNSTKFIGFMKNFGIRLHKKRYDPVEFNVLSFFVAAIIFSLFYFQNFEIYNQTILNLSGQTTGIILYMAILSTIVAYILYIKAQTILDISEMAILGYISPLFSLPAAFIILNEVPSNLAFAGLSIIFLGISIAESHKIKVK
jgi:drug/metabolite transporter (DMT)-like permease